MARDKLPAFFSFSLLGLLLGILLSLCLGSTTLSPVQVVRALVSGGGEDPVYRILAHVRLPRVLAALLAGSGLAVSGAIIQSVLSNPLASPNIMGVNSGAGLFVLLACILFPRHAGAVPLAAFLGAVLASVMVLLFSIGAGQSRLVLVLTGFCMTSVFSGGMTAVLILYPDAYVGAGNFLAGGLSGVTMEQLRWPCIYILAGLACAILCARGLNLLALGREAASALGMRVAVCRFVYLMVAAALAGAAVSFGGIVGFVGLVVPHAARFFTGFDNRILLPASAIWGAGFLLLCDLCARSLFAPYELPVGILMSFVGSPFFLLLVLRNRRRIVD